MKGFTSKWYKENGYHGKENGGISKKLAPSKPKKPPTEKEIQKAIAKVSSKREKKEKQVDVFVKNDLTRINIKPLSVNAAWRGRRFKSEAYKLFEKECLSILPDLSICKAPYEFNYRFGFSSRNSDLVNPEKLITDIICKRYGIDDRYIEKMTLDKEIVPKSKEYFEFQIKSISS